MTIAENPPPRLKTAYPNPVVIVLVSQPALICGCEVVGKAVNSALSRPDEQIASAVRSMRRGPFSKVPRSVTGSDPFAVDVGEATHGLIARGIRHHYRHDVARGSVVKVGIPNPPPLACDDASPPRRWAKVSTSPVPTSRLRSANQGPGLSRCSSPINPRSGPAVTLGQEMMGSVFRPSPSGDGTSAGVSIAAYSHVATNLLASQKGLARPAHGRHPYLFLDAARRRKSATLLLGIPGPTNEYHFDCITIEGVERFFPTSTLASPSCGLISEKTGIISGIGFWRQDAAEKRAADHDF